MFNCQSFLCRPEMSTVVRKSSYSNIQETVQYFRVSQQHIQPSIFLRGLTFGKPISQDRRKMFTHQNLRRGEKCFSCLSWEGDTPALPCQRKSNIEQNQHFLKTLTQVKPALLQSYTC